ncbi:MULTISPECIES: hypothetical protein [Solibacillus]|uniref:Uncharacterized protein n=1 Tax=Solibacillus merdavium TaxID=2762218 RepID=A0ABR8XJN6_9BACL|nr:hypothetical protein [Solibacillus merdavium]MBD8032139.1 hypothetical protein [Solibacillus merdavium]
MTLILRVLAIILFSSFFTSSSEAMTGEKGHALQFHYEIIEQNDKIIWNIQYEDRFLQIKESEKSAELLLQFRSLIDQATSNVLPLTIYSCFIIFTLVFAVLFTFTKPKRLKHPLFWSSVIISCIFLIKSYSYYEVLQHTEANLRYYYLLLEVINSPY